MVLCIGNYKTNRARYLLTIFLWPIAVISNFNTQTMHIKSFNTQQHCYVSLKNLIPWRDLNPGLLVPESDVMSTPPRRQGKSQIFLFLDF
jgi:hypothetical protein